MIESPDPDLRRRFPVLDSLRAVGALAVLLTHTSFWAGAYTSYDVVGPILGRLDVGVAIFFVLSGFLLSRPWMVRAMIGIERPPLGDYFLGRALRIMPVYLVTVAIALAFLQDNRDLDTRDWLVTALLADIYVNPTLPAGLTQMWSLATEVSFYLVLPLLMFAAVGRGRLRAGRVWAALAVLCLVNLAWNSGLAFQVHGSPDVPTLQWLPAFLTWFSAGIGLALLEVQDSTRTAPRPVQRAVTVLAGSPGALWTAAFGLLLVASTDLAGPVLLVAPTPGESVAKNLLYAGVGTLLVFTGVFARPTSGYTRFMSLPVMRRMGHISYGIFCIHLPILHFVIWVTGYALFDGHGLQIFVLTLTLSGAAAEVLYRVVELPFMSLRHRNRRGRGPGTNAAVAPSTNTTT